MLVSNAGTRMAKAWCIETHDPVLSKYVAAREKDYRFNRGALEAGYVDKDVLLARLPTMPIDDVAKSRIGARIEHDFAQT